MYDLLSYCLKEVRNIDYISAVIGAPMERKKITFDSNWTRLSVVLHAHTGQPRSDKATR
jgi:hypothetical protein